MMVLFLANLGLELQKSAPVISPEPVMDPAEKVSGNSPQNTVLLPKVECTPCSQLPATEKKNTETKKLTTAEKFRAAPYSTRLDPIIKKMRGAFVGKLSHFAGPRRGKVDGALIEVDLRMTEGRLDGGIAVILTDENNTPYSRNRGNGGNKTIRYSSEDRIVYVEASPNSFFAFRAREFDSSEVKGDYYYEDNAMVGKALLFRQ